MQSIAVLLEGTFSKISPFSPVGNTSQITRSVLQNLRKASLFQRSRISYNDVPVKYMFISFCSCNWRARLLS